MHPLSGVRVLELSDAIAVRYCGRLLAQLGADVVRPRMATGDDRIGYGGKAGIAYGEWLDDGKRVAEHDQGVDLVLTFASDGPASVDGALHVSISWFAPGGPRADWPATDETILAAAGLANTFGESDGPPTLAQGHVPQLLAGANACAVAIAALLAPRAERPRRVEVDVFESTICLTETGAIAALVNPRAIAPRMGVNRFAPTYPTTSYETIDGWVGVTCITPAQWSAMCDAIGRPELAADESMSTGLQRLFAADAVDAALAPAIRARTTAEWVAEGDHRRIPITSLPTPAELPHHEHWADRGSFGPIGDTATLAPTIPFSGSFDGDPVDRWQPRTDVDGPLSGLRVVDFTMGWAGPFATRTLGDLGADVVKIESDSHPDWWRGWEPAADADPPEIEIQPHFNAMNRNKRGVSLDLQTEEGRDLARALIARADVVIDNYAAGVLDKLGLGHDVHRVLRPGIVSVSMPAFGTAGPLAGLRAYGSTVEQASGLPWVNGHAHWPPSLQHVAFGDPIAGLYGALATVAALAGRQRLGGSSVELAQVACLFELCADAIVAAQVTGEVPRTGSVRPRLGTSDAFVAADGRYVAVATDVEDAERVRAFVGERVADDAASELRSRGIAAATVVGSHDLGLDDHLRRTGYWQELERVHVGTHPLGAPAYRIDGVRPAPRRPAPVVGEHTVEVVAELGRRP